MSVALAAMESAYSLRLSLGSHPLPFHHMHHHHLHHHHQLHSPSPSPSHLELRQPLQPTESPLRFSVVNILRPDFGRDAIITTKKSSKKSNLSPKTIQLPHTSPLAVPRDLSLSSSRLSPQSPAPTTTTTAGSTGSSTTRYEVHRDRDSFSGSTSPLQRHSTGLSRSGSLESLASNRSSINGSLTGTPSLSSAASTISTESISGDSVGGSTAGSQTSSANGQSPWPAWVYCTRYSDRPSSGKYTYNFQITLSFFFLLLFFLFYFLLSLQQYSYISGKPQPYCSFS